MEKLEKQHTCPRLLFKQKMNLAHNHLWAINELENGITERTGRKKMTMKRAIDRNKIHLHAVSAVTNVRLVS